MSDKHSAGEQGIRLKIEQAIARGWCDPATSSRIMDGDLVKAIAEQIEPLLTAATADAKLAGELAMQEAEPWLYAIADRNGNWRDGENCIFGDSVTASEYVQELNDEWPEDEQPYYHVVPLYRLTPDSAGVLERHDRKLLQQYADRIEHLSGALTARADELERIKLAGEMERLGWEVARRDVFTEAVNALDSLWAAIGDALCSSKGIKREYANAVSKEVAQAKRRCENARELTPDSVDVLERIKRAERARGAEKAYRRCGNNLPAHPHFAGVFFKWADAEQAAIADGAQK